MFMREHLSLGKFSNSVIESFHKTVRFHYQGTAREGGKNAKEACYAVMQRLIALRMLTIEFRGQEGVDILKAIGKRRADCACAVPGQPCR